MTNTTAYNEDVPQRPPRGNHRPHQKVEITLNGEAVDIQSSQYLVSDLKQQLNVPDDYELEEIVHGELRPLRDNQHVHIKGGEVLVSHVRRGGSA